ncbi:Era Like 12S Mitochondrial RRNA Chaperone 1 [Allomyces arbusculus]|nr:Era Like 12S Mitochondrial RRNA Chaperone 1 [Allomyces arbusculus]
MSPARALAMAARPLVQALPRHGAQVHRLLHRPMSIMARAKLRAGIPMDEIKRDHDNLAAPFERAPELAITRDGAAAAPAATPPRPTSIADLLPKPVPKPDVMRTLQQVVTPTEQPTDPQTLQAAVLGPANAGKSSLVNALIASKVSVVSPRAQTTRERITGIWTEGNTQVVFSDTPGIVDSKHRSKVSRGVITASWTSLPTAQHVLVVLDAAKLLYKAGPMPIEKYMFRRLAEHQLPTTVVFNKMDLLLPSSITVPADAPFMLPTATASSFESATTTPIRPSPRIAEAFRRAGDAPQHLSDAARFLAETYASSALAVYYVSASQGWSLDTLRTHLLSLARPGEHQYPSSVRTDTAPQALLAQFVRQGFYERLYGYLPYALRQRTAVWEELPSADPNSTVPGGLHVVQEILVDRPGQEKIVVGSGGKVVVAVQQEAGAELERVLGYPVRLFLDVKVKRQ